MNYKSKSIQIHKACTEINRELLKTKLVKSIHLYAFRKKESLHILQTICPKYNVNIDLISKILNLQ